jgi:hypothetical protein
LSGQWVGHNICCRRDRTKTSWKLLSRPFEAGASQGKLSNVARAGHASGRFAGGLDRRQEESNEHADDGDNDKEFDEGETSSWAGETREWIASKHVLILQTGTL